MGPNITPHPSAGIGAWSDDDFVRAMREGRSPDGHSYWPAFPYPAFQYASDQQLADIWAYLRSVPPADTPSKPHDLRPGMGRVARGMWRALYFDASGFVVDASQSEAWNMGAQLGAGIGHCGECHSPRNRFGAVDKQRALAGHPGPPEAAPNITPGAGGLANWTHDDRLTFLETGMSADGDFVGGEMGRMIEYGVAKLSAGERAALALWLGSVAPIATQLVPSMPKEGAVPREDWE